MNSSGNLISLSESGVGTSLACGRNSAFSDSRSDSDFHGLGSSGGLYNSDNKNLPCDDSATATDLLIDFSDEVQVPVPPRVLLQAEVDDTFGIFSMAQQSRQESESVSRAPVATAGTDSEDGENYGGQSGEVMVKTDQSEKEAELDILSKDSIKKEDNRNNSIESCGSDQATIVESDDNEEEKGIFDVMDEKSNLTTSSNFSVGSDSEILDINNLSSFSISDDDMGTISFFETIKKKDMVTSSMTAAIVNQIKMEMLQDEVMHSDSKFGPTESSIMPSFRTDASGIDEFSQPTLPNLTSDFVKDCRSSMSSASMTTTHPTVNQCNTAVLNTVESTATAANSGLASITSRTFGSPIRASYPLSNRYFMPTPKATDTSNSRGGYRDKLSESLLSPSRTRVLVITGDSNKSPCRVPVRKSISVETLHYCEHSTPARIHQRHSVKFSTPAAGNKSRHSFNSHSNTPRFPNLFGDDRPEMNAQEFDDRDTTVVDNMDYIPRRRQTMSFTSNSNRLIPSPSCSSEYARDDNSIASKEGRPKFDESVSGHIDTAIIRPVKATAVVAPTSIFKQQKLKPALNTTLGTRRTQLVEPSQLNPAVHHIEHQAGSVPGPIIAPSPVRNEMRVNHATTPSRMRSNINVRSSGYGRQQNLNATFGSNQPLKAPSNTALANIKPAAIPKLKSGISTCASSLQFGIKKNTADPSLRSGTTALKTNGQLQFPGSKGLRRPISTSRAISSAGNIGQKENKRPTTAKK